MAINLTNVNLYLSSKDPDELIELQLINNAINGVHYNYQTPTHDGASWFVWFFEDLKKWKDPSTLESDEIEMLRGANV